MKALIQKEQHTGGTVRRIKLWPEIETQTVRPSAQRLERIAFHVHNAVEFVDPITVTHLEAQSNYTLIHFASGRRLLVSRTLKSCTAAFPGTFLRIHQSFLVNPQYIQTYLRNENELRFDSGLQLPVSRSGKGVMNDFVKRC